MSPKTNSLADRHTAGTIVAAGSERGIGGLQVFVHRDAEGADERIGAAVTDSTGAFEIHHRDVARSLEISAPNSTKSVIVPIERKRKAALRIQLSADDLATLMTHRDVERGEDKDRWERQRLIGREASRSRAQRTIGRSARQRAFGERVAEQIDLHAVPKATREDDKAYVDPDMAPEDRLKKALAVADEGLKDAPVKERTIKMSPEVLAELKKKVGKNESAAIEDVVVFGTAPVMVAPTPEALDILDRLRDKADAEANGGPAPEVGAITETDNATDTGDTEANGNGGGTTTPIEPPAISASPSQYVSEAIARLNADGRTAAADAPTAAGRNSAMKGGPADTTSYHEFRDVRIAFDPMWTELYDHSLSQAITKILGGLEWLEVHGGSEV